MSRGERRDLAWGKRVVADLRGKLGRDPSPTEVIEEARRRTDQGLRPPRRVQRGDGRRGAQ